MQLGKWYLVKIRHSETDMHKKLAKKNLWYFNVSFQPHAGHEFLCQCNIQSLCFMSKDGISTCKYDHSRLARYTDRTEIQSLPRGSETSGLLLQVETIDKQAASPSGKLLNDCL